MFVCFFCCKKEKLSFIFFNDDTFFVTFDIFFSIRISIYKKISYFCKEKHM
jgi:hypothetical protein